MILRIVVGLFLVACLVGCNLLLGLLVAPLWRLPYWTATGVTVTVFLAWAVSFTALDYLRANYWEGTDASTEEDEEDDNRTDEAESEQAA